MRWLSLGVFWLWLAVPAHAFQWCEPFFVPDTSGYLKVVVDAQVVIRATCDGPALGAPTPTDDRGESCVEVGAGEDINTSDAYVWEVHPLSGPGLSEIRWIGVPASCP